MTDRPTLALLPGLLCDTALWQSQVAALAGLEVIDDCGHLSPLEQLERVNVALRRWLEAP